MLSTILGEEDERDPHSRDRHLVINRTAIDFNKKSCKLVSIKDISFKQRLRLSQRNTDQIASELTTTLDLLERAFDQSI